MHLLIKLYYLKICLKLLPIQAKSLQMKNKNYGNSFVQTKHVTFPSNYGVVSLGRDILFGPSLDQLGRIKTVYIRLETLINDFYYVFTQKIDNATFL